MLDHAVGKPGEREYWGALPRHRLGVPSVTFCLFVLWCLFFYPHPSSFSAWLKFSSELEPQRAEGRRPYKILLKPP